MNNLIKKLTLLFPLILSSGCSTANQKEKDQPIDKDDDTSQEDDSPKKSFLFIGNSHTMFNDMTETFKFLGIADGKEPDVKTVLCGGHTLEEFANPNDTYGAQVITMFNNYHFDYVILQENSDELVSDLYYPNRFHAAVRILAGLIEQNGAKGVFYSTQGNRLGTNLIDTEKTVKLAERYRDTAEQIDMSVAYAGFGYMKIYGMPGNEINLHYSDNHHPSEYGSYLAASVIYQTIFPKSDIRTNAYNGTISKEDAETIRNAAYEVVKDPSSYFND